MELFVALPPMALFKTINTDFQVKKKQCVISLEQNVWKFHSDEHGTPQSSVFTSELPLIGYKVRAKIQRKTNQAMFIRIR